MSVFVIWVFVLVVFDVGVYNFLEYLVYELSDLDVKYCSAENYPLILKAIKN